MADQKEGIKVNFPERLQSGSYANNMIVAHTREEFIMDFMLVAPSAAAVTARIIVSPGHIKRILAALQDNLDKYEKSFGSITKAEEPEAKFGF